MAACGDASLASLGLPSRQTAEQRFRGARSCTQRIGRLVDAVAAIYQSAAKSFLAVRAAADTLPAAARGHERMERAIDLLVDEALRPLQVSTNQRRTVRALLDARFWETLTEHGLDTDGKRDQFVHLLICALRQRRGDGES